jgi:hypothetical protein
MSRVSLDNSSMGSWYPTLDMAFLSIVENGGRQWMSPNVHATTIAAGIAVIGLLTPTAGTDGGVTALARRMFSIGPGPVRNLPMRGRIHECCA